MPFKCSCGREFTDIGEFANHKRTHQQQPEVRKGVMCLGCGSAISTAQNFNGVVACPSCHRNMKVVVEKGEVVMARLRG